MTISQCRCWWSGFTAGLSIGEDIVAGRVAHIMRAHVPMHINQHNVFTFIDVMSARKSTRIILSTLWTSKWSVSESRCRSATLNCCAISTLRCLTLSNPVPWQNWMASYLRYTLRMTTLFRGWHAYEKKKNATILSCCEVCDDVVGHDRTIRAVASTRTWAGP